MTKILLVGCGKMGQALVQGWLKQNQIEDLIIIDPQPQIQNLPGIKIVTDPEDIPAGWMPDVIIFAIKPQLCPSIVPLYKKYNQDQKTLFISIAAGQTVQRWEDYLDNPLRIARVMPNLPATVGVGISAFYISPDCQPGDKMTVTALFKAVGDVVEVKNEDDLHAITAISGSGPAYVYLFIEALEKAAAQQGLPKDLNTILVRQTLKGALKLLEQSQADPAMLRQQVTSPGGTTQAALEVLQPKFVDLIDQAIQAATKRSRELSQ